MGREKELGKRECVCVHASVGNALPPSGSEAAAAAICASAAVGPDGRGANTLND